MIRTDDVLHNLPTAEWAEEEAFSHLKKTFDLACRDFPEILEPYVNRTDGLSAAESKNLMREGLRDTFNQRWPNRFLKPSEGT